MKKILCFSLFLCVLTTIVCTIPVSAATPDTTGVGGAVVVNTETGKEVFFYNGDLAIPPNASARLMTVLVAYEQLKDRMDEKATITPDAIRSYENYNSFYIKEWKSLSDYVWQTVSIRDLFRHALVYSADDAVQMLAYIAFGSEASCVEAMNKKASELGMSRTEYTDAVNSSSLSSTTASDLAKLCAEIYKNPTLAEMASSQNAKITVGASSVTVYNRNLYNSSYYGTGYYTSETDGLFYSSSSGMLAAARPDENLTYVCVVVGADGAQSAYNSATSLLDYAMGSFGFVEVLSELEIFADIPVKLSKQADFVAAVPSGELLSFLPKSVDVERDITYDVHLNVSEMDAPISLGETVGYVDVIYEGESLGRVELVTNASLSKSLTLEFGDFVGRVISYPLTIVLIVLAFLAGIGYVLYRAYKEEQK